MNQLAAACDYLNQLAADGKQILFVGSKRQAQECVREIAEKYSVNTCSRLPLSETAAERMDKGTVEEAEVPELNDTIEKILGMR